MNWQRKDEHIKQIFANHPNELMTAEDIRMKSDIPLGSIGNNLARLVKSGFLSHEAKRGTSSVFIHRKPS